MQFNRTKGIQTPSGEVSVKSVHGRREGYRGKNLGEGVIHKGRPHGGGERVWPNANKSEQGEEELIFTVFFAVVFYG